MNAPSAVYLLAILVFWGLFAGCANQPDPDDPATRAAITEARNLGMAYLEENNLDEAEAQFQRLTQLNPDEASGFANLGIVYLRRGDYARALSELEQASSLAPADPAIAMNLADAYLGLEQPEQALDIVTAVLATAEDHVPALYKRARLLADDPGRRDAYAEALQAVLNIASANIVPRLELLLAQTELGNLNDAAFQLNELRQQLPALPREIQPHFDAAQQALAEEDSAQALRALRIFHNLMKVTPYYQTGLRLLNIRTDAVAGVPVISAPPTLGQALQSGSDALNLLEELRFTDASDNARLSALLSPGQSASAMAVGDFDGDADFDIFVAAENPGRYFLLQNEFGRFSDISDAAGLPAAQTTGDGNAETLQALWVDYDNDTFLDLYLITAGPHRLFRNTGEAGFEEVSAAAGIDQISGGHRGLFVDLDHDGDLDLFLLQNGKALFVRNNADGTFVAQDPGPALAGMRNGQDVALGDFDDDGDIDLVVASDNGLSLLSNQRQGAFDDIAADAGLPVSGAMQTLAVGDYNNDGFLDLFAAGPESLALFTNDGTRFTEDTGNSAVLNDLTGDNPGAGNPVSDAAFLDFDNDGYLDLVLTGGTHTILHNDGNGRFTDTSNPLLADDLPAATRLTFADYNLDRDLDLFLTTPAGPLLLRNDGGHQNRSLSIQTRGLLTNNSKNNYYSIGARVEVRAGDLYQMRVVTSPTTYVGLGQRIKADVVRIVFTNGVPQNIFTPGTDQDIIEQQILKGSCPFLYTWNGTSFEFATDILWRSALGMPTGIMGGSTTYAPASPAEDYIKIPAGLLREDRGTYHIRITGELWETPYFDEVKLLVVDHPAEVEAHIDEKFGPPLPTPLPIHAVPFKQAPLHAVDEAGRDVRELLARADSSHVVPGSPSPYQGLMSPHELILTPDPSLDLNQAVLYLKGWIFPTDASINIALAQSDAFTPMPPQVQVKDARGNWQTVIPNMGFPMGKNKTVRVDLRGKFLSEHREVRIRSNMQVYWDQAFFTVETDAPMHRTTLTPAEATLRYRGFSKMYRTSPSGPHLFDYNEVSTSSRWRDLEGNYTRYGDVMPLLQDSDDRYVIMNAGDEMALSFDAPVAPPLPEGWNRTFILYSNGWLKDGDLNTAKGNTVEPLPFAGMSAYPYGADEAYPMTPANRQYLETYNTRVVNGKAFREALKSVD